LVIVSVASLAPTLSELGRGASTADQFESAR